MRKGSVTDDERRFNLAMSESAPLIQHCETLPSIDSDVVLQTAIEVDKSDLVKKLEDGSVVERELETYDSNKSQFSTSSLSFCRRSVSPDTMLRGATSKSNASMSSRWSEQTSSLTSDYSSDLSFFGMNNDTTGKRLSSDTLVEYWWDLTPHNIHTIIINYLYDIDNKRCNQCWTFFENKFGISRVVVFYGLVTAYILYILSGDLAKLLYYAIGVGYPMYRTYSTHETRGLSGCRSWLRYWVVFGWLSLLDVFFYHYLRQWTVYWSVKTIITIYLLMPLVKGADLIYRDFIKNFNRTIERNVRFIVEK